MSKQTYTNEEKKILSRYFTNTTKNVFGLINLPEQVKGALFARYSRTHKPLRRLFLDEFYTKASMPELPKAKPNRRAAEFYDRVFSQFGDDSIAQLCSAHVAVEDVSILTAKELQRSRLAAYLEKSTRYLDYTGENFKCIKHPYADHRHTLPWGKSKDAYKLLLDNGVSRDDARGILPVALATSFGIHANGQTFERMAMRPSTSNWEANSVSSKITTAVSKVLPNIMYDANNLSRYSKWHEWDNHYRVRAEAMDNAKPKSGRGNLFPMVDSPSVKLIAFGGHQDLFDSLIAYRYLHTDNQNTIRFLHNQYNEYSNEVHRQLNSALYEGRKNRRHLPERMLETMNATIEIVSDYATYRDLQRHRMATIEMQPLTHRLGYYTPKSILNHENPEVLKSWNNAMAYSHKTYETLVWDAEPGQPIGATRALNMATNVRYVIHANLRQWLYMIELRSAPGAHSVYRELVKQIYRQIETACWEHMRVRFSAQFYYEGYKDDEDE